MKNRKKEPMILGMRDKDVIALGGVDTVNELNAMGDQELKDLIAQAAGAIQTAKDELEANTKYLDLKERMKDVTASKREVTARQNAKIKYSLQRLGELGKLDSGMTISLTMQAALVNADTTDV